MKNLVILDCTLRDGGYYNGWDFDRDFINLCLVAMEEAKKVLRSGFAHRLFRVSEELATTPLTIFLSHSLSRKEYELLSW